MEKSRLVNSFERVEIGLPVSQGLLLFSGLSVLETYRRSDRILKVKQSSVPFKLWHEN